MTITGVDMTGGSINKDCQGKSAYLLNITGGLGVGVVIKKQVHYIYIWLHLNN